MAEVNVWTAVAAVAGPSVTAIGGWWVARRKGRTDAVDAQAAMVKAAQEAAKAVIDALETRVEKLQSRVDSLETQLQQERNAWREERHSLLNDLTAARGECRQLQQRNDSLTRLLQAAGIDLPDAPLRMTEPALLAEPA